MTYEATAGILPVWWAGVVLAVIAAALYWPIVERRTPRFGVSARTGPVANPQASRRPGRPTSACEHPRLALGGVIGIVAGLPVGNAIDGALGDVLGFATIVSIIGVVTGFVGSYHRERASAALGPSFEEAI